MVRQKHRSVVQQREKFIIGCKFIDKARKEYCKNSFISLGIDPSLSSTGWSLRSSKGGVKFGAIVPKSWGFSRMIYIENIIKKIFKSYDPFVGIENYSFGAKWGREKAGELGGVIRRTLFIYKRPLLLIAPLSIKSWVKVSQKNQIMLEIFDRYKVKINNDDAADAFILSEMIRSVLYMAHDIVERKFSAEDVKDYLKNEEYKDTTPELDKLFKYQANSIFNLIAEHGKECVFFSKASPGFF